MVSDVKTITKEEREALREMSGYDFDECGWKAIDYIEKYEAALVAKEQECERLREALSYLPRNVPINWLDPLLTGDAAVLPKSGAPYSEGHVKDLLRALRQRLTVICRAALQGEE